MSPEADFAPHGEGRIQVRRGRVSSIDVYEVKEGELEQIESGIEGAILDLTYASILFSAGVTCIAALFTSEFKWDIVRLGFLSVAIFGTALGFYVFYRWHKRKSSTSSVVNTIRQRIRNGDSDPKHQPANRDSSPS